MTYVPRFIPDRAAFGEQSITELTPIVHLQFPYNINTRQVDKRTTNAGTITQSNDHVLVSTGTSSASKAMMRSNTVLKYNAGQGSLVRFTAIFTDGVVNSEQTIGIGDENDGFFFGYNGTSFGILRRRGGIPEIQTLTINTASSDVDTITITLDGDAKADVSVTDSADKTVTAQEIADADYSDVGNGWTAKAVGDKVVFISWESGSKSGAFTLSDASSAVGTFAETVDGVSATDSWIAQASWNEDAMVDGTGPSAMTLDQTKGNVYQIQYQWLGYGAINFFVENSDTGAFQLVHRIKYANANTSPSISNPTLPLCIAVVNTTNATDMVIKSSSMAGFVEGKEELLGLIESASNVFTIGHVTTEEPVLTIRNKMVYQGRLNRVAAKVVFLTLSSNLAAANSNTTFRIYSRALPLTSTSYGDVDTATSVVEVDTAGTDLTGGSLLASFVLDKEESILIDTTVLTGKLIPGETLMVTAQPSKGNASNEVGVAINWVELF